MKNKSLSILCAALINALVIHGASAAATDAEIAKLGGELTPVGAQRSANADASIPAWSGETAIPQGEWSYGKNRGDFWKHKDEKTLFTIDASNVDQHADKLSPGQVAMIKKTPGYEMRVYPAHRECSYPDFVLENTKAGAKISKIAADGWSLEDARLPGVPFPVPKTGIEAMWNYLTRYQGVGVVTENALASVSPRPGTTGGVATRFNQVAYYPWGRKGSMSPKDINYVQQGFYYAFQEPVALAGQALVQTIYMNKDAESFYYFTGQRRVRRLPNYAYDTPIIGFENQFPNDSIFLFYGNPDRFDWKLVGKKEMYVQYNNFKMLDTSLKTQGLERPYIDNDARRYELHRVWVVEGTVKDGVRHSASKKVFYLDEDTWLAVAGEDYDANNFLWRHKESSVIPIWELGACSNTATYYLHDLVSGRYVTDSNVSGGTRDLRFYAEAGDLPQFKDSFYTAESLRAISDR